RSDGQPDRLPETGFQSNSLPRRGRTTRARGSGLRLTGGTLGGTAHTNQQARLSRVRFYARPNRSRQARDRVTRASISNRFAAVRSNAYNNNMSTAQEIEDAIRSLSPSEREKLLQHIPHIFPEFAGDADWERIARDDRLRPA